MILGIAFDLQNLRQKSNEEKQTPYSLDNWIKNKTL